MLTQLLLILGLLSSVLATKRPIIGILFQEPSKSLGDLLPNLTSYLPASYVRAIQASGARVAPIHLNRDRAYYRSIVSSVNGLLLPGGNTWFYGHEGGYADSGDLLLKEVIEINNKGSHFPILGICLGFELLLFLDNNREEYRFSCSSKNISMHLNLKPDYQTSRLFQGADKHVLNILETEPVTFNQHGFCVSEKNLTTTGLSDRWMVISTNQDPVSGEEFISIVESKNYPFVGLQFHPEKNSFEWKQNLAIPHSHHAILSSRFFFDRFVDEARLNNNTFSSEREEEESLIYRYPTYSNRNLLSFDEIYCIFSDHRPSSEPGAHSTASKVLIFNYVLMLVISASMVVLKTVYNIYEDV